MEWERIKRNQKEAGNGTFHKTLPKWPLHKFWMRVLPKLTSLKYLWSVWPDWAIYWTLDKFLKPLATINLPKSATFLGNFCKGVKILHFSFLGNFYRHLAIFSGHTACDWKTVRIRYPWSFLVPFNCLNFINIFIKFYFRQYLDLLRLFTWLKNHNCFISPVKQG